MFYYVPGTMLGLDPWRDRSIESNNQNNVWCGWMEMHVNYCRSEGQSVQGFRHLLYPCIGRCQATLYYTNSNMCVAQMCFQNGLEKWDNWLLVNISRADSWLLKKRPRSQGLNLDRSGIHISPFSENGTLIPSQPNWTSCGESHADCSQGLRDSIGHLRSQRDHFSSPEFLFLWVPQTWCSGRYMVTQSSHAQPTLDVHALF